MYCSVVVAFGGQTAIKLTKFLHNQGIQILGTSADSIDMAEDRERFDALLERLDIKRPKGFSVLTMEEALEAAERLSYPVLLRPSYVLGGQNMIIAFTEDDIREYMKIILSQNIENPNTHGTGCTLSSAIAANLVKGYALPDSIRLAKEYVTTIISAGLDLGQGSGPMDHGAAIKGDFTE